MRLVPARSLLLALFVPMAIAVGSIFVPGLIVPLIGLNAVIIVLAIVDGLLARRLTVEVTRTVAENASIARELNVELRIKSNLRRTAKIEINDDVFVPAEVTGLPAAVELAPGRVGTVTYQIRPLQRGSHTLGAHFVRFPSPGRLWTRQLEIPAQTRIRVFPDVQAVRHFELLARRNRNLLGARLTRMRGGDTEFERLRDFLPDDEFKRIDWRATARRRKLTVREFQLEQNQNLVFLLDCGRVMSATWSDLSALDYALNATLMLAHVAVRQGDRVGLIAFDKKVTRFIKPRGGVGASNRIIQATYDLFPQMVEPDYEQAFRTLKLHVRKRTLVVLISHTIDEETAKNLERLCRDLIPRHLPLCVLLRDENLEARAKFGKPGSPDSYHVQAAAAEMLLWRDQIINKMRRAGILVLDVFHHQLTPSLVSRYLEVKAGALL